MSDVFYCRECNFIGHHTRGAGTDNCWGHDREFFGVPAQHAPPIGRTLLKLGAGVPITNTDAVMFRLGLAMEDKWTPSPSTAPVAEHIYETSPVPALASVASTRSQPASTPISATDVSDSPTGQIALDFGEGA